MGLGRNRNAFTLVELLVVIGVVGVLIALLMPVLSRARAAANDVSCASNLRQWASATHVYAAQTGGWLPRRGQGIQPTNQIDRPTDWFNALPEIMKMPTYSQLAAAGQVYYPGGPNSVWLCPTVPSGWVATNYWSYGMNMGLSVQEANQNNGKADRISTIGNLSTMVFMTDGPGNYAAVFPSITAGGYNPVARHGSRTSPRVNIAFMDGHVAAYSPSEVGIGTGLVERADLRWHPPRSTWNSAR